MSIAANQGVVLGPSSNSPYSDPYRNFFNPQPYHGNQYELEKAMQESLQQSEFTPGFTARMVAGQDSTHDLVICGAMGRDLVATRLRMSHRQLRDKGLAIVQCMANAQDRVFVVVNITNTKPVILEDGMDLFPSDELVTKLRALMA